MELPDFTPPDFKPPKIPEWATYIPARTPKFKSHNQKRQALSACNIMQREAWLYRLFDEKWIPWAYKPPGHRTKIVLPAERLCQECGKNEVIDPSDYMCQQCRKAL